MLLADDGRNMLNINKLNLVMYIEVFQLGSWTIRISMQAIVARSADAVIAQD